MVQPAAINMTQISVKISLLRKSLFVFLQQIMMKYLSILQSEAEKVCGVNVNFLKYYSIKKPSHSQQIQRKVMVLNSFFAEKLLSHGVENFAGYYRQVLFCMMKCFNLAIYLYAEWLDIYYLC